MMIKLIKTSLLFIIIFSVLNCKKDKNIIKIKTKITNIVKIDDTKETQKVVVRELNNEEIQKIFTTQIKENIKLKKIIKKIFEYEDRTGLNYLITSQENNNNSESKAIEFLVVSKNESTNIFEIKNRIKDFVLPVKNNIFNENSISIWHKYLTIKDLDKDGYIDSILVYGTKGENGFDDGRIKFIILYKGKKIVIRHQNGILDDERHTEIEENFYQLSNSIKRDVLDKMNSMIKNRLAIFNYDVLYKVKNSIKK